jgi:hypothetical protein
MRPEPHANQWDEHPGLGLAHVLEHRSATGDQHAQGPRFSPLRSSQGDLEDHPRADWDSLGDEAAGTMLLAQSYTQQSWVKDFVNGSAATVADNDQDEELVIALPV